jgi:hypothetical protein
MSESVAVIVTGLNPDVVMSLYPNPVMDELSIEWGIANEIVHVSLTNLIGDEMTNATFRNNVSINMNNYTSGIYLLKLTSGSGIFIRKIIKL